MGELDDRLWTIFVTKLTGQLSDVKPDMFMPATGATIPDWEGLEVGGIKTTTRPAGETSVPGLKLWANRMPQWKPSWVPGRSFYDQYRAFLTAIDIQTGDQSPEKKAELASARAAEEEARTALSAVEDEMTNAYLPWREAQQRLPKKLRQSYFEWFDRNWRTSLENARTNLNVAEAAVAKALQDISGPDALMILRARTAAELSKRGRNGIVDADTKELAPAYTIQPRLSSWVAQAASGRGQPITIDIDLESERERTYSESFFLKTSVEGGYGSFAWGGSVAASYEQADSKTERSHLLERVSMTYEAEDTLTFNVTPGSWYDSSTVGNFARKIDPDSEMASQTAFGPGGFLNLRTNQIVCVYNPKITLRGEASAIEELTSSADKKGGGSLSVGGMAWSVKASASGGTSVNEASMSRTSDGTGLEIRDVSGIPKVVGVVALDLEHG